VNWNPVPDPYGGEIENVTPVAPPDATSGEISIVFSSEFTDETTPVYPPPDIPLLGIISDTSEKESVFRLSLPISRVAVPSTSGLRLI